MSRTVRVRFAPSPTGALHVGGARTAIYNWAFARRTGGVFILRIDDTDPGRSIDANTKQILRSLEWLGLDWDEGPEIGGDYGPYFQTKRHANYVAALERMKANGSAYPCFCSIEELEAKRQAVRAGEASDETTGGYDRTCRRLDPAEAAARVAAGEPCVWRLAVPENRGDIVVIDAVRGETIFPASAMDDYVLARGDGTPTYNFATVVDDADMEITHVIRGDDHLSNTPRQILVYEALGHAVPMFAHLSMIWGSDAKKLSKRHGATSVEAFRDEGYLPEALLNYLALLGWSLDGETTIIPADVLKSSFSLERISKNPAIFDFEKLEWMNGIYIRNLAPEELATRIFPSIEQAGLAPAGDLEARRDWYLALVSLVQERLKRLTDIVPMVRYLFTEGVEIEPESAEKILAKEGSDVALAAARDALATLDTWSAGAIDEALRGLADTLSVNGLPRSDASPPDRDGHTREKDAGSGNSSAIAATEDVLSRRSDGRGLDYRQPLKPKQIFQVVRVAVTGSMVSLPLFESLTLLGKERTLARLDAARATQPEFRTG